MQNCLSNKRCSGAARAPLERLSAARCVYLLHFLDVYLFHFLDVDLSHFLSVYLLPILDVYLLHFLGVYLFQFLGLKIGIDKHLKSGGFGICLVASCVFCPLFFLHNFSLFSLFGVAAHFAAPDWATQTLANRNGREGTTQAAPERCSCAA